MVFDGRNINALGFCLGRFIKGTKNAIHSGGRVFGQAYQDGQQTIPPPVVVKQESVKAPKVQRPKHEEPDEEESSMLISGA